MKGVRSVRRPTRHWRDDIVGQRGAAWTRGAKDRESLRTLAEGYLMTQLEDSGGGLLNDTAGGLWRRAT